MAALPYIIPYDPALLGTGFSVPLPAPDNSEAGLAIFQELLGAAAVYDYTFSLVKHAPRRQVLFSDCNLDGDLQKQASRRSWSIENRVTDYQIGNEAYRYTPGNPNAWDRGHLVRRKDVCWRTTFDLRPSVAARLATGAPSPQPLTKLSCVWCCWGSRLDRPRISACCAATAGPIRACHTTPTGFNKCETATTSSRAVAALSHG